MGDRRDEGGGEREGEKAGRRGRAGEKGESLRGREKGRRERA